jgi:hypothetical protein
LSDILTYLKKRVGPLPPPKKKKKSRNTWKFSKRKPYVILLNKELVAELDQIAIKLGISRSMLVEQILRTFVEHLKTPEGASLEIEKI